MVKPGDGLGTLDALRIEPFKVDKHSVLVGPLTELLHEAYGGLAQKGFRYLASYQSVEQTLERLSRDEFFLAFWENRLVGTLSLYRSKPDSLCEYYRRPGLVHFGQFAVQTAFQGRGIARKLLQHMERRAGERGASEIALDTAEGATELIEMYQRHGYLTVSNTQWSTTNYPSVVMAKRLNGARG